MTAKLLLAPRPATVSWHDRPFHLSSLVRSFSFLIVFLAALSLSLSAQEAVREELRRTLSRGEDVSKVSPSGTG